jgi:hypothetical protein
MKALFITTDELKRKSIIQGDTDDDKLVQFIEVAQDIHIQTYLGTDLYNKLQELIISDTISDVENEKYKYLTDHYIKPMLVWYSQESYLPFAMYKVGNTGVFKVSAENSSSVELDDVNSMMNRVRENSGFYTRRFLDYMKDNCDDFPEYKTTEDDGMKPAKEGDNFNWVL